jgi:S-adenosylmethionine:tRNA ribosyltransferase-isomerase
MRVDDFDYELPSSLIAMRPAVPRGAGRLLVVRDGIQDRRIRDLPDLLVSGDVLVFNDTRVIPARLNGRRGLAAIELTLHKLISSKRWAAFARPARRLKVGDRIEFGDDFAAAVVDKGSVGEVLLDFNRSGSEFIAALGKHGAMPLPPYIARKRLIDSQDESDYQTVFGKRVGAVAAPTAGLHFSLALLASLDARRIRRVDVTLHVGAGTFLPVKVADTSEHQMHAEWGEVTAEAAATINDARMSGGRIVAIGTTAARLLETAADGSGKVHAFAGDTALFITPGYRFKAVDVLMTNFHLPRSTLLMLIAAFAGLGRVREAYEHAKRHRYRFYSYGDATLLFPGRK